MKRLVPARSWQPSSQVISLFLGQCFMTSFQRFIFFHPLPVWPRPMAAVLLAFVPNVAANPPTSKMNHVTPGSAAPLTKQSVPDDQNPPVILVDAVFVPPCRDKTWSDEALTDLGPHRNHFPHRFFFPLPVFNSLLLPPTTELRLSTKDPQHVLMIDPV